MAVWRIFTSCLPKPTPISDIKESVLSSWNKEHPVSHSAKKKRNSASAHRQQPNSFLKTAACRRQTCWVRKAKVLKSPCPHWMAGATALPPRRLALHKARWMLLSVTLKSASNSENQLHIIKAYRLSSRIWQQKSKLRVY